MNKKDLNKAIEVLEKGEIPRPYYLHLTKEQRQELMDEVFPGLSFWGKVKFIVFRRFEGLRLRICPESALLDEEQ